MTSKRVVEELTTVAGNTDAAPNENAETAAKDERNADREEDIDWRFKSQPGRFERRRVHREDQYPYHRHAPETKPERVLVAQYVSLSEDVCGLSCTEKHTLKDCREFPKKSSTEKIEKIKFERRCFDCLGLGHLARRCPLKQGPRA